MLVDMEGFDLPPCPARFAERPVWLEAVSAQVDRALRTVRIRSACWAWTRLGSFALATLGLYIHFAAHRPWGPWAAAAGVLVFIIALRRHERERERLLTLRLAKDVIAESKARLAGEPIVVRTACEPADTGLWSRLFDDDASDRWYLTAQELDDLDVFGDPRSIYGILNRTSSPMGAVRLGRALREPLQNAGEILARQEAARWLSERADERLRILAAAAGMRGGEEACRNLLTTVSEATPLPGRSSFAFFRLWSLAGPAAVAWGIAGTVGWIVAPQVWLPAAVVFILNSIVMQSFARPVRERIRPWLELGTVVGRLSYFARVAVAALPDSGLLGLQRNRLEQALMPACLPALERRIGWTYFGLSGILHTIVDIFVFWDLHVLGRLERCYLNHRSELLGAMAALAECELVASLACFASEEPDAVWPEPISDAPKSGRLVIRDGRHPLLATAEAVPNSVSLGGEAGMWIVTGSNMSGKSTFLRMAGVSVLLAQVGSAVTAAEMLWTPMPILTDLRIRDDLTRKESYFLAEVRQVRRMIELARGTRPILGLIDEPFRGTNSEERIAAASAVIRALMSGCGVFLVATHDAALVTLADGWRALNYHFRESFDRDQLVFDHRLYMGPAESRNALRVLEGEGYPPEVVAEARRFLAAPAPLRPAPAAGANPAPASHPVPKARPPVTGVPRNDE